MAVLVKDRSPLRRFSKSLVGLKQVQFIQHDLEKTDAAKRPTKVWYLNQSYLFHLVALWEIFIEEQVAFAFEEMIRLSPPGVFEDMLRTKLKDTIRRHNTPNKDNINEIFKAIVGIEKISNTWTWDSMPLDTACTLLNEILVTRHEIAHQSVTKNQRLSYDMNFDYMKHLINLAYLIDYAVRKKLAVLSDRVFDSTIEIPYPSNH